MSHPLARIVFSSAALAFVSVGCDNSTSRSGGEARDSSAPDFTGDDGGTHVFGDLDVGASDTAVDGCGGPNLTGIVRDFKMGDKPGGHPDFETFNGGGETGIVLPDLGSDRQ